MFSPSLQSNTFSLCSATMGSKTTHITSELNNVTDPSVARAAEKRCRSPIHVVAQLYEITPPSCFCLKQSIACILQKLVVLPPAAMDRHRLRMPCLSRSSFLAAGHIRFKPRALLSAIGKTAAAKSRSASS